MTGREIAKKNYLSPLDTIQIQKVEKETASAANIW